LAAADADEWASICTMILMIRGRTMMRATIIVHHSIRLIIVPNADGTARLAAADADEWAGEGVGTMIGMII